MSGRFAYFLPPFLLFSFLGILTLNHYGVSWDEPEHFLRGQGYLRLFLSGKTTYDGLLKYDPARARANSGYHKRSYYQNDSYGAQTWFIYDKGHPPLNDILASLTNFIFYQKLGVMGDIESYHLFNILISAILVGVVFLFAVETFGVWTAFFAALLLATYPLFWAESHFNIKDPAQTSFFILTLYFFWRAFKAEKIKFIFISSLFAGFALSVKFNVLFLPFILVPWIVTLFLKDYKKTSEFVFAKKTLLIFLLFPILMLIILLIFWPFLWQDPLGNTIAAFNYYRELGTEDKVPINPFMNWNIYAPRWILYTTPPFTLFTFLVGLLAVGKVWSKKNNTAVLWLFIFLIPVLRVSLPGTSIYGGVRQIMEYIPGMVLLAGVGANNLREMVLVIFRRLKISSTIVDVFIVLLVIVICIYPLYQLHPNENVYFNFLTRGLHGATENGMPAAGNSYGNAYFQGIKWLNKNAPKNSTLALIQGTTLNIPVLQVRPDIDFSNNYWSGIERRGEYLMELTYNQEFRAYFYAWEYIDKMLEPVYEVKVDGVPILKIWKNDLKHTKPEYRKSEVFYKGEQKTKEDGGIITLSFPQKITLSRLIFRYTSTNCAQFKKGYVRTSLDGQNWITEQDPVALDQLPKGGFLKNEDEGKLFQYPFAAREARFISIGILDIDSCISKNPQPEIVILQ